MVGLGICVRTKRAYWRLPEPCRPEKATTLLAVKASKKSPVRSSWAWICLSSDMVEHLSSNVIHGCGSLGFLALLVLVVVAVVAAAMAVDVVGFLCKIG